MAMNNPYNQYKENSIKTASPQELTLMLYNGAIKFINQSKIFIEEKNVSSANEALKRAQDIIEELNNTLDMKYDISDRLRTIYTYILERLREANIKKDITPLNEAMEMVTELRDTWKEAMKLAKNGNR
ncbi:flagellar export chaperone FliS [Alkaliphilus peptidifermentans]|uniref:Flagellar secretion chaperone FliS n=1 Tax=Alkaliphilus peptidifermentans DSM 18978 TaxID=1120976 RepID=A0A1G5JDE4_9FIRM|nr:flagellar export chaperone FliS [Alkaliphilus peptidifermentans]SCY86386.1 flagellar protein FliS [Alkaliphilus peptidifermentans DSM 18978]